MTQQASEILQPDEAFLTEAAIASDCSVVVLRFVEKMLCGRILSRTEEHIEVTKPLPNNTEMTLSWLVTAVDLVCHFTSGVLKLTQMNLTLLGQSGTENVYSVPLGFFMSCDNPSVSFLFAQNLINDALIKAGWILT